MEQTDAASSFENLGTGPEKCPVLVVDDDSNFRMIVRMALQFNGYDALTAANGREAVEIASRRPDIRLLITDVAMPGLNGMELAAKIREILPGVEVLYISGIAPKAAPGSAEAAGPVHFLQKPFEAVELDKRIKAILARS